VSDVLVLCYHAVSPTWEAPLSVTPERFQHQLETLLRRGYRGATFRDAVTRPPHRRTVAITFDDAYRSVLALAFPILDRLGLPATVFVPTSFAGASAPMAWPGIDHWSGGDHERELLPLGWPELRGLSERGWEIGSHTVSHPRLTQLDDRDLAAELGESKQACEEALGAPCGSIAYPYGDVDERVVRAARAAGYSHGAALPPVLHAPRPLEWPRTGIYHTDAAWRFRLKGSLAVRFVRLARARARSRDARRAPYRRRSSRRRS